MNRHATAGGILVAVLTLMAWSSRGYSQTTCVGDCNGDDQVTVDEIVRMVGLVLGGGAAECAAADGDGNSAVTVDEVVTGVTNALFGCSPGLLPGPDLSRLYPGPRLAVGDAPVAVVAADFDGDAVIDLASANSASSDLSLLRQSPGGGFSTERLCLTNGPEALITAQLDGDALPDLVAASPASDQVWVALSSQALSAATPFAAGERPGSLAAGDFNGDLRTDVVVGSRTSPDVSLLLGDGAGSFAPPRRFEAGGEVQSVAVADLNGDLQLDVVAASGARSVAVLFGDGDGALAAPVTVDVVVQPVIVLLDDLNTDQSIDLIILGQASPPEGTSRIAILFGDGAGAFDTPLIVDTGMAAASMVLGDVDGNALTDIVLGNDGSVSVSYAHGDGMFGDPVTSVVTGEASAVAVADLDGDGAADVVYAGRAADEVAILWGLGDRRLAAERVVPVDGMGPTQILTGDMDGDGTTDIASVNRLSDDVSILLNDGEGGLGAPIRVATDEGLLAAAVGDLNGSAGVDLVTANATVTCRDCLQVFESTGDGSFAERQRLVTAPGVVALAIEDFDGDGIGDIVSLNGTAVSAFRGMGNWGYEAEREIAAGSEPRALAVADLDGDLLPDIAVANSGSRDVSVLLATAAGDFEPAVSLPLTFAPIRIRIADLNADGIADIFVRGDDRLSVLIGEGGGSFAPEASLIARASGGAFDLADVNADGRIDFVTLAGGTAIYPGLVDLTFGAPQRFAGNPLAIDLKALDIDGDGAVDAVTANAALAGSISVISGRPQ